MTKVIWDHYIRDQQRWADRLQALALEAGDAERGRLSNLAVKAFLNARDVDGPTRRPNAA